jgi:hypothetical protein
MSLKTARRSLQIRPDGLLQLRLLPRSSLKLASQKIESSSDTSVHSRSCIDSECTNEVHLNASALSIPDALYLPICIASSPDMLSPTMNSCVANTLVDSGSDRCFVDPMFLNKFNFSPYSVIWMDSSPLSPKALNCTLVSRLEKSSGRSS